MLLSAEEARALGNGSALALRRGFPFPISASPPEGLCRLAARRGLEFLNSLGAFHWLDRGHKQRPHAGELCASRRTSGRDRHLGHGNAEMRQNAGLRRPVYRSYPLLRWHELAAAPPRYRDIMKEDSSRFWRGALPGAFPQSWLSPVESTSLISWHT